MKHHVVVLLGAVLLTGAGLSVGGAAADLRAQEVIQPPWYCPNTNNIKCATQTYERCTEWGWRLKILPGFEFERVCQAKETFSITWTKGDYEELPAPVPV